MAKVGNIFDKWRIYTPLFFRAKILNINELAWFYLLY
nr:MAG TPA_asm: hypothetical protein [Caudoviricetes sp.]